MVRGIDSYLEVQTSGPCTTDVYAFTTLYNMLYSPGGSGWSQVGYYKDNYYGNTHQWMQFHENAADGYHDWFGGHVTAGSTYRYRVVYVPNGCYKVGTGPYSCIQNRIDGVDVGDTPFDPASSWGSSAWNLEYSEESYYVGGNVPGTTANQAGVTSMTYEDSFYTWHDTTCTLINYINNDTAHWAHYFFGLCPNQTLYTSHPY